VEQGYVAARLTALSILGSLQRALGDLNRVASWGRIDCFTVTNLRASA
jgi:hypothetical protein